jgi:hypothetical protein
VKDQEKQVDPLLEEAVSRALRDNLAPLQRTADDLQQAYADFVAACSSSRPSNTLPAMLRAQTAASSLAAGLAVLSNFVTLACISRDRAAGAAIPLPMPTPVRSIEFAAMPAVAPAVAPEPPSTPPSATVEATPTVVEDPASAAEPVLEGVEAPFELEATVVALDSPTPITAEEVASAEAPAFDIDTLPATERDLHRRANRVAKVAMQDIKLLRPADVRLGREHKDICGRLRTDLDKARKEYDRRFRAILDHPVDYFHYWMVAILADGDAESLGEYPYPSPVLRH